jgi:hypothetical protein
MSLWRVTGDELTEIEPTRLDAEQRLEDWIVKDPALLGMDLLIIGRQVRTPFAGRIDLLAVDAEGDCVIVELKRDLTPRDVVAQVLDYATWVKDLGFADLDEIAQGFLKKSLADAFRERFDTSLPDTVNAKHGMVVVASQLDDSSERILTYLSDTHGLNINAVFFTTFKIDGCEVVGRAWLKDPVQVEERSHKQSPWSGYWFVNVGQAPERTWDDNVRFGYLGAGQGPKYSKPLKRLPVGAKVFAYMRGNGYVGFGEVAAEACMIRDFRVEPDNAPLLEKPLKASRAADNSDDPELSEWVVGVRWLKTVAENDARTFKGVFANPNIVCKLRDQATVDFLLKEFNGQ